MSNALTEKRVMSLGISMEELKETVAETSRQVARTSVEMSNFREESKAAREAFIEKAEAERAAFREEMRQKYEAFSKESREYRETFSKESKAEREAFHAEMKEIFEKHWAKMDKETRRHNLEMGRIANKQGTMVEDLVGPSIGRILKETLGIDEETPCLEQVRVIRFYRGDRSRPREFDAIADCEGYALINETKSELRPGDIDKFLKTMSSVRDYFPEYADYKLIGAVASLRIEEGVVNYATKKGVLALAVGLEIMDVQNPPGFRPRFW